MTASKLGIPKTIENPYADLPAWARTLLATPSGRSVFAAECTPIRQQDLWSTARFQVVESSFGGNIHIPGGYRHLFQETSIAAGLEWSNLACDERHAFIGTHLRFDAFLPTRLDVDVAPDSTCRALTFEDLTNNTDMPHQGCVQHWRAFRELLSPIVISLQAPLKPAMRLVLNKALYVDRKIQSLQVQAILSGQLVRIP